MKESAPSPSPKKTPATTPASGKSLKSTKSKKREKRPLSYANESEQPASATKQSARPEEQKTAEPTEAQDSVRSEAAVIVLTNNRPFTTVFQQIA